jgi:hypothetical protein
MSVLRNDLLESTAKPVRREWQWVVSIGKVSGVGVLDINGAVYTVTLLHLDGRVIAYRLEKLDGATYDIDATGPQWTCDCPDATYRQRECKHLRAVRAALAAVAQ